MRKLTHDRGLKLLTWLHTWCLHLIRLCVALVIVFATGGGATSDKTPIGIAPGARRFFFSKPKARMRRMLVEAHLG